MKKLKIIVEEPSGSRKAHFYNVKTDKDAKDIVKMVEKELKPRKGFSVVDHRIIEER
jgi:hypothetical protein